MVEISVADGVGWVGRVYECFCFVLDYFGVIYVLLTVLFLKRPCIVIYFVEDTPSKTRWHVSRGLSFLILKEVNKMS